MNSRASRSSGPFLYTWEERLRIRKTYEENLDAILQASRRGFWIDPYEYGDLRVHWNWSRAEYGMWGSIRGGRVQFYPEFPVGRYFVDFGDPLRKIAIEVDGSRYHAERTEEDAVRQIEIEAMGWKVYRIPARACFGMLCDTIERITGCAPGRDFDEWLEERGMTWEQFRGMYMYEDSDLFIEEIREREYGHVYPRDDEPDEDDLLWLGSNSTGS